MSIWHQLNFFVLLEGLFEGGSYDSMSINKGHFEKSEVVWRELLLMGAFGAVIIAMLASVLL